MTSGLRTPPAVLRTPPRRAAPGPSTAPHRGSGPPPGRRWPAVDETTVLLATTGMFVVVPRLLQSVLSPKVRTAVGDVPVYSPIAGLAESGLRVLLVVLCVVAICRRLRALPTTGGTALLLFLSSWTFVVVRDLFLDRQPGPQASVVVLVAVTMWVVRPPIGRMAVIGVVATATAVVSILLALALPEKGIFVSAAGDVVTAEKALLPAGLLVGPFTAANNLALVLVIGLPCLLLLRSRSLALLCALPVGLALVWASSRGVLTAAAAAVGVGLLLRALPVRARAVPAFLFTATAAAAGVVLPLVTTDPDAFTHRGVIWSTSLAVWREQSPLVGLGANWYSRAAQSGENAVATAFHGHNQFVHVLVTGGLVGAALHGVLALLLCLYAARWARRGLLAPSLVLIAMFVGCWLEVGFGFKDRAIMMSSSMAVVLMILFAARPVSADIGRVTSAGAPSREPAPRTG